MPTITFAKSGKTVPWNDSCENLLDFAEAHGVAIAAGCRCGADTVCMTRILSGRVTYTQEPLIDVEPGAILPCICKPETDVTLDA
ncbi:MAG: 2Fe-2S iron-sulfur cluster-binding protein [Verrucomicrobiota bacterium]|nr:2Fe-2S iron-sulfur cluster-binding protein [Verrucomicrobiota bacterium]